MKKIKNFMLLAFIIIANMSILNARSRTTCTIQMNNLTGRELIMSGNIIPNGTQFSNTISRQDRDNYGDKWDKPLNLKRPAGKVNTPVPIPQGTYNTKTCFKDRIYKVTLDPATDTISVQ